MEYKLFIMGILNDLYLIREDVKEGPGHDAISALINKIESRPIDSIEKNNEVVKKRSAIIPQSLSAEVNVSTTEHDGVYVYQFKK